MVELSIMHGILGSTWPKMTLATYVKFKEDTLVVYCLYFVGFLVRCLCGFSILIFTKLNVRELFLIWYYSNRIYLP